MAPFDGNCAGLCIEPWRVVRWVLFATSVMTLATAMMLTFHCNVHFPAVILTLNIPLQFKFALHVRPRGGKSTAWQFDAQACIERAYPAQALQAAGDSCVICLEATREGQLCRQLPQCGHSFHADCVDEWWLRKGDETLRCPTCRQAAPATAIV
uniref:RING-type domain-containing protein n=1 Tax=Zooxanthella nutricula TaxID=1333877 RepID=A0A7S2Q916_9DINO